MSNKITSTFSNELHVEAADKKNIDAKEIELKHVSSEVAPGPAAKGATKVPPREINGPKGLEPTRYGDWESKGRCYDF
jgi:hypothetical protein